MSFVRRVLQDIKAAPTTAQLLGPWQHRNPQAKEWDETKAVKEGFKISPYVYACVDLLATNAASVPWKALTRRGAGDDWEPSPGEPVEDLLEFPNSKMSRQDLMERLVQHLELGGNGIWSMILATSLRRDGKVPVELWPLDPAGLRPIPDREKFILGYEYIKDGVWIRNPPIPGDEVIHFMRNDPSNPYWGMGPLQAAASAVDTDVQASRWNRVTFANRAVPDGVFSIDRTLTRDEWEAAREEVRKNYAGAENARTPWVLGSGAKWEMMSWKPTEMDFIEGRKFTREEICAAFHVPLPMVEVMENATLANLQDSRKKLWSDGVIPLLDNLKGVLNRVLVPLFGDRRMLMLDYDLSGVEVLRADEEKKSKVYETYVKNGIPPNVAIDLLDMDIEPIDGGDVGYIPNSMIPLTMAGEIAQEELRMGEAQRDSMEVQNDVAQNPPKKPKQEAA